MSCESTSFRAFVPLRRRSLSRAILLAAAATQLLPAGGVLAQVPTSAPVVSPTTEPVQRGVSTTQGGGVLLNFKDASIEAVLDQLSEVAGFVVVKETPVSGRISLVSKQPLNRDEIVPLLNSVLKANGYAAIQMGRQLKIVRRDVAKTANIPVRTGNDPFRIEPTDELITQVIPIRYADATQLRQDLSPMISTDAAVTANASSNAIIVTDSAANVRRLVEIISALDTHLADASEVKVYQLKYAAATSTAKLINDIFGQNQQQQQGGGQQGGFGGIGNRFARFFGGGGGGGGGFGGFGGGGNNGGGNQSGGSGNTRPGTRQAARVFASSDDRTNTLVVTAPTDVLEAVGRVINEIDSNPVAEQSVFIYNLKNGDAANIEVVMNNLLNPYGGVGGAVNSSRSTSPFGNTPSSGGFGNFGGGSSISSNRSGGRNNSSGNRNSGNRTSGNRSGGNARGNVGGSSLSAAASAAASDLTGQVSVVANPDTNSLLVMTAPKNFDRVKMILDELDRPIPQVLIKVLVAEVTHDNSSDLGAEFSVLNLRNDGKFGQSLGTDFGVAAQSGGIVTKIFEDNFTAALRAIEATGKLDVLSRPYILASDNQLANIVVGNSVPFITNTRVTETGQTLNTIEYRDLGIIVNVTPHINPDGLVILDVNPEISNLTGQTVPISETVSAPVYAVRSAQSRVGVRDGQTIVIGGLMEDRKTENVQKVPLLGDIPGLGALFRRTIASKAKTELLIFLTPHVAPRPDLLKEMSQDEMKGTKLTPNAVAPGAFQEHMEGMRRGSTQPTTQP